MSLDLNSLYPLLINAPLLIIAIVGTALLGSMPRDRRGTCITALALIAVGPAYMLADYLILTPVFGSGFGPTVFVSYAYWGTMLLGMLLLGLVAGRRRQTRGAVPQR